MAVLPDPLVAFLPLQAVLRSTYSGHMHTCIMVFFLGRFLFLLLIEESWWVQKPGK